MGVTNHWTTGLTFLVFTHSEVIFVMPASNSFMGPALGVE